MVNYDGTPAASPAPTYPIPVWGTPEAVPTEPVAIVGLPQTGFGDAFSDPGPGWPTVLALVVLALVAAAAIYHARKRNRA